MLGGTAEGLGFFLFVFFVFSAFFGYFSVGNGSAWPREVPRRVSERFYQVFLFFFSLFFSLFSPRTRMDLWGCSKVVAWSHLRTQGPVKAFFDVSSFFFFSSVLISWWSACPGRMLGKVAGYPSRADTLKFKEGEREKKGGNRIEGKGFCGRKQSKKGQASFGRVFMRVPGGAGPFWECFFGLILRF
jgi:hypothetical protein